MSVVIDTVGILVIWFAALGLVFYGPFLVGMVFARSDEGLSAVIIGLVWGKICAVVFVLASVAYLAAT